MLSAHSLVDPAKGENEPGPEAAKRTQTFREVLACLDGSELGTRVMRHARLVAAALGARLTLLRVVEEESVGSPQDPLGWGLRLREARAHLRSLAEGVDLDAGIRSEVVQGRAAEQICAWADQHQIDLTVLCSHGVRGVTDWRLASNARKLIDRIPGSLLLVPAGSESPEGELHYRKILVPLDGSARAESVLPVAMRIANAEDAELILAHVVPVPEITRMGALDAEGAELERRVVEHNRRIAGLYIDVLRARINRSGTTVRSVVVGEGNVPARLDQLIRDERPSLVLMSSHGSTGRAESACGSVTEHAVTHATTPLLVVRDPLPRRARRVGPSRARALRRSELQEPPRL